MASNPAGLSFLQDSQLTLGSAYLMPETEMSGRSILGGAAESKDYSENSVVPYMFYSTPINDKLTAGAGVYVPFGNNVEHDQSWGGRYNSIKSELTNINIQATLSYKIVDSLSVGAGLSASYIDGAMTQSIYTGGNDAFTEFEGDSWAPAFNVGLLWQALDHTRLGISYRSQVKHTIKGTSKTTGLAPQIIAMDAEADMTLPEIVEFSVTHAMDSRWYIMAGLTYTRWSKMDTLTLKQEDGTPLSTMPQNWENVWNGSIGTSYQYSPSVQLKAGFMYEQSPVNSKNGTTRIPDIDRRILTLGMKYSSSKDWSIDVAYGYTFENKNSFNEQLYLPNGTPSGESIVADYKTSGHTLNLSFTKRV